MGEKESRKAREIIRTLKDRGFYAECPCCGDSMRLRDCGLFYLDDFTPEAREIYNQLKTELAERAQEIKERKEQISTTSEIGAKAVNIGFILERLAPSMSTFRFARNDCRSLFDPIDYVIFEGLSEKGVVTNIVFADIKTGGAILKSHQREIRSLVQSSKVYLETSPRRTKMIRDILFFFAAQRNIFGICPRSGELFRLSDCKVYLKGKPRKDWMDNLDSVGRKLDLADEKLDQKEESMREKARKKGRRLADLAIRRIDSVFTPRHLNPDDAKVIFHPVDYIVFCGMKGDGPIKRIVLLDRIPQSSEHRKVQESIATALDKQRCEWKTIRVHQDGKISEE